jgi:nucleotide-binding universal stress UspA family protein
MTIKRILVPLADSGAYTAEIATAVSVARSLAAHIEAFYVHQWQLQRRATVIDSGMYRTHGSAALAAELPLAAQSQPAEERGTHAQEARQQLAATCAANGIRMLQPDQEPNSLPSASWYETEGSYVDLAAQRAAAFDLVIAASASVMESLKDVAEQSLLATRRPVLLAPARLNTKLTDEAVIAWRESSECWHAISAALPFLKLAQSVRIVSVDTDAASRRTSQADVLTYLRCHGISATSEIIAPQPKLHSLGDMLLTAAAERECGVLVMGAYSHSRLREMLLGSATRHILRNASTRPVLMAH